jgi:bifunctional non-homologous end joining protein LigD
MKLVEGYEIEISNPGKILFPESGITKGELVDYYEMIGPVMLPYVQDRPLTIQRYPNGIHEESFFQKAASDYYPKYIKTLLVNDEVNGKKRYPLINNVASLVYLANLATIPLHVWQSKKGSIRKPDQVIWDLDPPTGDFEQVRKAAKLMRNCLQDLGLEPWLKTTGSKGLHLMVPLKPELGYEAVKEFAHSVGDFVQSQAPEMFTMEFRKDKREGKILVDYMRNNYGHTAVAPYSVRPKEGAPVAAPLQWDELEDKKLNAQTFNIKNIAARLKAKGDLWEGIYDHAQSLKPAMKRLKEAMAQ